MASRPRLLVDPVGPTLTRLAGPMFFGILAILLFTVVDTFWVGQLGVRELAAMSFTFPVAATVSSLAMGLAIGGTAVIARAIGDGNLSTVRRLTTHALALANAIVVVVALTGLALLEPLFTLLGAGPELLPLIRGYMVPWFLGVGFLVIPMVGNSAIRATGDTKTPSLIMATAGLLNAALDPLLIFGWGPFPRLGLQGAALATVISWMTIFTASLWVLGRRERMLDLRWPAPSELWDSWRRILHVGLPTAATFLLMPVAGGVITRMAADYGESAVAAFGVSQRLESLALVGIMALASASTPFAGQNSGAARWDRVGAGFGFAIRAGLVWTGAVALLLAVTALPLAALFSDAAEVRSLVVDYLWIVPLSYTGLGAVQIAAAFLNGTNRPIWAAALSMLRLFGLSLPGAALGAQIFGVVGLFVGMAVGNALSGVISVAVAQRWIENERARATTPAAPAGVDPIPVAEAVPAGARAGPRASAL